MKKDVSRTSRLLPDADAERLAREKLAGLALEEKVSLSALCATMYLNAVPRAGIDREWSFNDCSHSMKPEHNRDRWGYVEGVDDRSTALPCLSALASTWNRALAAKQGDVMGSQMRARDKSQILGPGLNIMRNPLCGRNWEYMSEDPYLVSRMAVGFIKAAQAHGLACTPKHFCLNNQELNRFATCSTVDDRALNEIYLPAFEAAVKEGGALSLMTAYNHYNGTFCSENSYLQKAVLRERWGFKGTIVTDWGGQHSCDNAVMNGAGIEANCGKGVTYFTDLYASAGDDRVPLATAVKEGRVPASCVDDMALRTLYVMAKTGFLTGTQDKGERLVEAHREAAKDIGREAVILAKNAARVLPLDKAAVRRLVVFGRIADLEQAELGSSCECHVERETTFLAGLKEYLGADAEITHYPLGGEADDGHPRAIDHLILETFDPDGADAFAERAWERRVTRDGATVSFSYDKTTRLEPGTAQAGDVVEWSSSLSAPESGRYVFSAETSGGAAAEIFIDGEACAGKVLERGRPCAIVFRVTVSDAGDSCVFGWTPPGSARPPADEVRRKCEAADAVIVFTGTTMGFGRAKETEGADRPDMKCADGHDAEIAEILSWNLRRTVVVCRSGSALELPWLGECDTLVLTSYLGQEAGHVLADVLFGAVNPSGKLPYSWPKRYADTPTGYFGERAYNAGNSVYLEGIYVGYRWYEKRAIETAFPFGHGLSYTTFGYGEASVETHGDEWEVSLDVTNTGDRDGAEVVQLYARADDPRIDRPVKELKGFEKVFLAPGETKRVSFAVTPRDLAYWDVFSSSFRTDPGTYSFLVGSSSSDIRSRASVAV